MVGAAAGWSLHLQMHLGEGAGTVPTPAPLQCSLWGCSSGKSIRLGIHLAVVNTLSKPFYEKM